MIKNEDGAVAIIVAVSMVAILSLSALVIDVGRVYIEKSRLQGAVDAATRAATLALPDVTYATEQANYYFEQNGYDPVDLSLTFNNGRVDVSSTKTIEYSFAKIIGKDTETISVSSAGVKESAGGPFGYTLFSGSSSTNLTFNGSNLYVGGSVHSNKQVSINCSSATITDACRAASFISINGSSINVPNRFPHSQSIEMPDFSDEVKKLAESEGDVYYEDKSFSDSELRFDKAVYVDGNVSFNTSKFTGVGTICATGDINFNGSSLDMTTAGSVCFYSVGGNININGSSIKIDGILYAQQGSVRINASTINVNGRIIGNSLAINTSNLSVVSDANDLDSLPSSGKVRLVK